MRVNGKILQLTDKIEAGENVFILTRFFFLQGAFSYQKSCKHGHRTCDIIPYISNSKRPP